MSYVEHAQMCLGFLGGAADLVEFLEYANNRLIVESIGMHIIFGKIFMEIDFFLSQKSENHF